MAESILRVPLLEQANDKTLEQKGSRFDVCTVNWPEAFPYAPICAGRIARTRDALVVSWRVSGLDLTVRNTQDGGTIWEDSCCEIFLQAPGSAKYYNIEVNAAGILLVGCGTGRGDRVLLPPEKMALITRKAEVKAPVDISDEIKTWSLTICIPFQVIGLDPARLPDKLLGNIYKCGDKTAHPHFLSWAPIATPNPDFHRPEFFGTFLLG
ncbi:MAG: hypothetical protein IK074_08250 [Bacteroidales bacterium]|nr:hypothetical protein [Bacteroidales bacterium]